MSEQKSLKIERHPGPFTGPDAELARAAAMAAIPWYGDDDEITHQEILKNGVWNDHIAVQSALAAIHYLKTEHDRRVTELLDANSREVEKRRQAEGIAEARGRVIAALTDVIADLREKLAEPTVEIPHEGKIR